MSGNILAHADVFIDDHSEDEVRIVEDHIPPFPLSYSVRPKPEAMGEFSGEKIRGQEEIRSTS